MQVFNIHLHLSPLSEESSNVMQRASKLLEVCRDEYEASWSHRSTDDILSSHEEGKREAAHEYDLLADVEL